MTSILNLDPETQISTPAALDEALPSITTLADGSYVVCWFGPTAGSEYDIYFQRYSAEGTRLGGEVRANTTTADVQRWSDVAATSDGGFVIVWDSRDGTGTEIFGQKFTVNGAKVGGELAVDSALGPASGYVPHVSGLIGGGFVAVWDVHAGVYSQIYNAAGEMVGAPTRVNAGTAGAPVEADVVTLANGSYVVTWISEGVDGDGAGVYFRHFSASGTALSGDIRANSFTTGDQNQAAVAALDDGGFIVTWTSAGQDGSAEGVYAQRYNGSHAAVGAEFRVNSGIIGVQREPAVAGLDDGGFVITWETTILDGSGYGIYAQRYDAQGHVIGSASRLNTFTTGDQTYSAVTGLTGGGYVGVWHSEDEDGQGFGVYGRAFRPGDAGNGAQYLFGTADADRLDGGSGADLMYGGFGDDTYVVNSASDAVSERSNEGTDTVESLVSLTLSTYLENLILSGLSSINGTGNASDNILIGNAGRNVLTGGAGNDDLSGLGGNDQLVGGDGGDYLDGGAGNDLLSGGAGEDDLYGGEGNDLFAVSTGYDTINGGAGIDYYDASGLAIGAVINLLSGRGLQGAGNVQFFDGIEFVIGSGLADTIIGNAANNTLDGRAGADNLRGVGGDDTYAVDDAGDLVSELLNSADAGGEDLVVASVNFVLANYVEDLTLIGAALAGTGNSLANVITGNSGANTLNGAAGIDTLIGGTGDDLYYADNAGDVVVEKAGEGADTVRATISFGLADDVETLILMGSANLNGTGNAANNLLFGNTGANILNGGVGNDQLTGGTGADTFQFGTNFRSDIIKDFNSGQGDVIQLVGLGSYVVAQAGAHVTVDLGGGNIITVQNAAAADVSSHIITA